MKPPIFLKTILDICFFFLLVGLGAAIIFFAVSVSEGTTIPIEFNGRTITEMTATAIVLIVAELIIGILIVYTVYVLRKLIRNFFKGKLFTKYQIAALRKIGNLIVFITLVQAIIGALANFLLNERTSRMEFNFSFNSFWFVLAIGLFFVYLSKIFDNARTLKEENELTV